MQSKNFLVTMIIYATSMLLLVSISIMASCGAFDALSDEAVDIIGSLLPQVVVMFGVPFLMMLGAQKKVNHQPVSFQQVANDVGWHKMSLKNVALVFLLGVCLYLLNIFVASFFGSILQGFGYQYAAGENAFHGYWGLVISIFLSAVLPGFCEEFLHRGVLLNGCMKQFGLRRAILWTSLLFGLMHMNVGQFFYATVLGWFFCVTALSAGSLWASMIVHFVNNALATYMGYAEELNLPAMNLINYVLTTPVLMILTLIVVIVSIGGILRHLARERFQKNLDTYTVRYLSVQNQFNVEDFERVKRVLPKAIAAMPTWKATFAYIETFELPKQPRPLERALLAGIWVLGATITIMSFVWGTW